MENMDTDKIAEQMNEFYRPLEMKGYQLLQGLFHRIFDPSMGFYNGYSRRGKDGRNYIDRFPIPVITLEGLCDIEVHLDGITVTTKLSRADTVRKDYKTLERYAFSVCESGNSYDEMRYPEMSIAQIKERMAAWDEKKVCFAFYLDFDIDGEEIYSFAKLLRRERFFL